MLDLLPVGILEWEITQYLDYPSLVALKLVNKQLFGQVETTICRKERIYIDLKEHSFIGKQLEANVEKFLLFNPLQLRCILERRCFYCQNKFVGAATVDLYVYGHQTCIEKLLVSALLPDNYGDIPMYYLPDSFPALVYAEHYETNTLGRPVPTINTCYIFEKQVQMVQEIHTLQGFLRRTDLPKLKNSPYSPKRVRARRTTPPPRPCKKATNRGFCPQNVPFLLVSNL